MSIFTETIGAVGFEVYAGVIGVANYLAGDDSAGATAFRNLGTGSDSQKRRVITATRYIDSYRWQGVATGLAGGTSTTLQFPRSGLTDLAGAALDPTNVPSALLAAVAEMAAILSSDPEAKSAVDAGSNLQSLRAGPASLSFFRPTSAQDGTATRLPQVVNQLIGRWLASSAGAIGIVITGASTGDSFGGGCSTCGALAFCGCASSRRDVVWPI